MSDLSVRWANKKTGAPERPCSSSAMSRTGYPSAGCSPAEPASASPTEIHFALQSFCRSRTFHRTANSVLTVCVSRGDKRNYNIEAHEVQVRLYVSKVLDMNACRDPILDLKGNAEIDSKFWVGLFDFPIVDNTRMTQSERCALSLTDLTPKHAEISLAYFSGSRASLKDKPYCDELEHDLRGGAGR